MRWLGSSGAPVLGVPSFPVVLPLMAPGDGLAAPPCWGRTWKSGPKRRTRAEQVHWGEQGWALLRGQRGCRAGAGNAAGMQIHPGGEMLSFPLGNHPSSSGMTCKGGKHT